MFLRKIFEKMSCAKKIGQKNFGEFFLKINCTKKVRKNFLKKKK